MLRLVRIKRRAISLALATLMALATGPFAHAAPVMEVSAPQHSFAEMAMPHHAHASHQPQAAAPESPDSHHEIDCCGDLGLCSTAATLTVAIRQVTAEQLQSDHVMGTTSIAGLYEPGLDLPPPRTS